MKIFVVVEGLSDVRVLRALLPTNLLAECDIVPTGGRSAISSVARTLLVKHQAPLAVVFDTETLDATAIRDAVVTMEGLLKSVAGDTPCKAISCAPELEAIFFQAPIDLKRVFPAYGDRFFILYAKTSPKEALDYLFQSGQGPTSLPDFLSSLTGEEVEGLRTTHPIRHLINFIEQACNPVA